MTTFVRCPVKPGMTEKKYLKYKAYGSCKTAI